MIILSCGHVVSHIYEGYPVTLKDEVYEHETQSFVPAVSYREICRECYDHCIDNDMILPTLEYEENYLRGNIE